MHTESTNQSDGLINNMDPHLNRRDAAPLPDLLAHLRRKIEAFEEERLSWLSRLESVALAAADRSKTDRDIRQLERERTDLARAVSEARVALLQERGIAFHIQKENLQLERREFDQRQERLRQLASGGVVEVQQSVTLAQGKKPEAVTRFPNGIVKNELSLKHNATGRSTGHLGGPPAKTVGKTKALHRVITINGVNSGQTGSAGRQLGQYDTQQGELDESLEAHIQVG